MLEENYKTFLSLSLNTTTTNASNKKQTASNGEAQNENEIKNKVVKILSENAFDDQRARNMDINEFLK